MSSSKSKMSTSNDFENYLNEFKAKKNEEYTHTRIPSQEHGVYGGTYNIPKDKLTEFWNKYVKHVIINKKKEYLTEKQLGNGGPILIDIDERYDPKIESRQHSKQDINNFIGVTLNEISKIMEIKENSELPIFVFEKQNVNTEDEKYTKDGIHFIIGIHADRYIQHMLRNHIVKKLPDIFGHLALKNSWEDVMDDNVCRVQNPVNWQMYGSRKPGHEAYQLKYYYIFKYVKKDEDDYDEDEDEYEEKGEEFNWEYEEKNVDFFDYNKNFPLLSAQYDGHKSFEIKEEYKQIYEEIKANKPRRSPSQKSGQLIMRKRVSNNKISLEDINNYETLTMEIDRIFANLDSNDYHIKETHHFAMCLPEKYYNPYDKWIRVGWALRNTDDRLFLTWMLFSTKSEKFDYSKIPEFYDLWQTFMINNDDGLTKRSIMYWAHQDAREQYNEVYKKTVDYYIDITLSNYLLNSNGVAETTIVDMAIVLYNMFKNQFVCASITNNIWYEFDGNRWVFSDNGIALRKLISGDMVNQYNNRLHIAKTKKKNVPVDETSSKKGGLTLDEQRISQIIIQLKTTSVKQNLMKEAQEQFYDSKFSDKCDMKTHLLCCNNCVIDLKNKVIRKGQPDDCITMSTNIDYIKLDERKHKKIIDEIHDFMAKLFPEEEIRNYMWDHLASCLIGVNYGNYFNIYIGRGSNGKSMLVSLMSQCLGDYKKTVPFTLVTGKRLPVGSTSSELAQLKGARYAVMQEPSKGEKINEGPMKELTGGTDPIQARALFKDSITFIPQFKLVACTNNLPEIRVNDDGTWRRILKVDFKSKFTDNPVNNDPDVPYQFKKDEKLDEKLKIWAPIFLSMLVERAFKTEGLVTPTKIIKASSEAYRNNQDYFNEFITDMIKKEEGKRIKKSELFDTFKHWYMEHYDKNIPKGNDLYEVFDAKFGKYTNTGWKNITFNYHTQDVDEEDEGKY